jgi:hypothetical protein
MSERVAVAVIVLGTLCTSACRRDGGPTAPSMTAIATVAVANETFRIRLIGDSQIAAARAAQAGGRAQIPNGRIVRGTQVNEGWSWHMEEVEFAESTIELCDGRPSDVEREGPTFGGGRFCPWTARIVRIN